MPHRDRRITKVMDPLETKITTTTTTTRIIHLLVEMEERSNVVKVLLPGKILVGAKTRKLFIKHKTIENLYHLRFIRTYPFR